MTMTTSRIFPLCIVALSGCIWTPNNRTEHESTASVAMSGYADEPGQLIVFKVKNTLTGTWVGVGSTTASMTPHPFEPSLYPWSKTLGFGANAFSPQVTYSYLGQLYPDTRTGPGRFELIALDPDGNRLYTFSDAAKDCWDDAFWNDGATPLQAGAQCADGDSLVLFDNSGVGTPAETTDFAINGWIVNENAYGTPISWRVGHYTVQGRTVYALVCAPQAAGPHPVQIINHGGYGGLDNVVALETCKRAAARGWMTAMSAYRGEAMSNFPQIDIDEDPSQWEVCLGEVIDVLRLTELVLDFPASDPSRVLMWGHSHGACITERAIEQGAPVHVAAAFAAPTDFPAWYDYCGLPGAPCPATPTDLALGLGGTPTTAPAAYDWRSPITFAADLASRQDVRFLALTGTNDGVVFPSQACAFAKAIGSSNWHVDVGGNVTASAPTSPWTDGSCNTAETTVSWNASAVPSGAIGAWSQHRNLVVYDGFDHFNVVQSGLFGLPALRPWLDFEKFVTSQGLPLP
jgi:dienelactone hydrolase